MRFGVLWRLPLISPCALAQTLEIRTAPSGRVYLHEVNRGAAVVDFIV